MPQIHAIDCEYAAQIAREKAEDNLRTAIGMIEEGSPDDALYFIGLAAEHLRDWREADRVHRVLKQTALAAPPVVGKTD